MNNTSSYIVAVDSYPICTKEGLHIFEVDISNVIPVEIKIGMQTILDCDTIDEITAKVTLESYPKIKEDREYIYHRNGNEYAITIYNCPSCGGEFGVDSSFLDQVAGSFVCPMCEAVWEDDYES